MNSDKCAEKHSFESQYIVTRCNKQSPQIGCHNKTKDIMNNMINETKNRCCYRIISYVIKWSAYILDKFVSKEEN